MEFAPPRAGCCWCVWTEYEVAAPSNPFRLGVHIKFCLGVLIKMPTSVPLNIKRDRLVTQVVTFGAPTRCATPRLVEEEDGEDGKVTP